jgi:NADP-reducing hydrogenase subunit HndB
MTIVQSLEDLKQVREEALKKRQLKDEPGRIQIIIGIGTPAIAAGVHDTMKTILEFIETHNLQDTVVQQTGDIGMDSFEPIIQVVTGDQPKVTYGRVDTAAAERIMVEHVMGGQPVQEFRIESA